MTLAQMNLEVSEAWNAVRSSRRALMVMRPGTPAFDKELDVLARAEGRWHALVRLRKAWQENDDGQIPEEEGYRR